MWLSTLLAAWISEALRLHKLACQCIEPMKNDHARCGSAVSPGALDLDDAIDELAEESVITTP
jgi:hypothetical protein